MGKNKGEVVIYEIFSVVGGQKIISKTGTRTVLAALGGRRIIRCSGKTFSELPCNESAQRDGNSCMPLLFRL